MHSKFVSFSSLVIPLLLISCDASDLVNFTELEISRGEEGEIEDGWISVKPESTDVGFGMDDGVTNCGGDIVITDEDAEEIRDIASHFTITEGVGDPAVVVTTIVVDGITYHQDGVCNQSTCNFLHDEDFCKVQDFFRRVLEDSGVDLSTCPAGTYDILVNC